MDNSWNMVGLVGWWRRMEKENDGQMKEGERKQEKEARIYSIGKRTSLRKKGAKIHKHSRNQTPKQENQNLR